MFAPVYLDWNASAPLHPAVRDAMLPWLGERFGNASSRHEYGRQSRAAIDQARASVAAAVGAHPTEVVFTSGGSEANNLFLKGAAQCLKPSRIAISAIEHPCVREPARQLTRQGWALREIRVDTAGNLDPLDWCVSLEEKPALISVMFANNETGVVQDVSSLAQDAGAIGAWFHTDAVQAFGKIELNFRKLGVHAMTLSAHKIGGPLGAGALIVDKRLELSPLIAGGGQERGLRSGTENVAAIVGFGVASDIATAHRETETLRLTRLREMLEAFVITRGAKVFSAGAQRLPNTVFLSVDGVDGETLVAKLDRAGFAVASGSACSSANPEPSKTLLAMGISADLARNAIRVSLGRTTQEDDVLRFCSMFETLLKQLKNMTAVSV